MMISIITPVKDQPHFIEAYAQAVQGADEVLIVDTGSTPENRAAWSECGRIIDYPHQGHNYGHWCNAGYMQATGDTIIFLNNDIEAKGAWLPSQLEDGVLYGPELAYQHIAGLTVPFLSGWCIAATRATWKAVGITTRVVSGSGRKNPDGMSMSIQVESRGPWNTIDYPAAGYWEDNDLSLRAILAGLVLRRTYWPLHHINNGTSKGTPGAFADVQRNRATFARSVWAATKEAAHKTDLGQQLSAIRAQGIAAGQQLYSADALEAQRHA